MFVASTIGKILLKATVRLVISGGVMYVIYRLKGGKPIRVLYREVKAERMRAEQEQQKENKEEKHEVVLLNKTEFNAA